MEYIRCIQCEYQNSAHASSCRQCGAALLINLKTDKLEDSDKQIIDSDVSSDATIPKVSDDWEETVQRHLANQKSDAFLKKTEVPQSFSTDESYDTQRLLASKEEDGILRAGTVHFRGDLILKHCDTNAEFIIVNELLKHQIIIGRPNHRTAYAPTVDLTSLENGTKSISRCHAVIFGQEDLLLIIDKNSTNGTYLNGQHLVPNQARVLRDKDILRLGQVNFLICFRCPNT